jgi:hypothetical protein
MYCSQPAMVVGFSIGGRRGFPRPNTARDLGAQVWTGRHEVTRWFGQPQQSESVPSSSERQHWEVNYDRG